MDNKEDWKRGKWVDFSEKNIFKVTVCIFNVFTDQRIILGADGISYWMDRITFSGEISSFFPS